MTGHINIFSVKTSPRDKPSKEVVKLVISALNPPPWNAGYRPYKVYRKLQPMYNSPNLFAVCARDTENNLVGIALASCEVFRNGEPVFLFGTLCVDPAFHGAGTGRKLAQCVINEARDRGHRTVRLGTLKGSAAESLYTSMGFEKFDAPWLKDSPERQAMRLNLQSAAISPKA